MSNLLSVPKGRENEIWATANGESVCVSMRCMGSSMFSDIGNNIRQGKTFDGGYRYTADERAWMKDFLINECGDTNPTCSCGKVAF